MDDALVKPQNEIEEILQDVVGMESALDRIEHKLERIIMSAKTATQLLAELGSARNSVTNRIEALVAGQGGGGAAQAELDALKDGVQLEIDKLNVLAGGAVDPNNP